MESPFLIKLPAIGASQVKEYQWFYAIKDDTTYGDDSTAIKHENVEMSSDQFVEVAKFMTESAPGDAVSVV